MSELGKNYFQFPLCALTWGADVQDRLEHIISFGFVDAGYVMFNRLGPEHCQQKANEFAAASDRPAGYTKTKPDHVAAILGAREIGITFRGSISYPIEWIRGQTRN